MVSIKREQALCEKKNIPVCVQTGNGGLPVTIQMLRLLQQDVVEHPGDVDGDIILYWLKYSHVGADAGQQLTGLGYLLSSLVVHGHPYYGPAIEELPIISVTMSSPLFPLSKRWYYWL